MAPRQKQIKALFGRPRLAPRQKQIKALLGKSRLAPWQKQIKALLGKSRLTPRQQWWEAHYPHCTRPGTTRVQLLWALGMLLLVMGMMSLVMGLMPLVIVGMRAGWRTRSSCSYCPHGVPCCATAWASGAVAHMAAL